jgi:sugar phosphate permease
MGYAVSDKSQSPLSPQEEQALYRRMSARLVGFLIVCYLFAFIDRVSIGFARSQISASLSLTPAEFGFAAGIFFLGYVLCEVPSNLLLLRIGARISIARLLILMGAVTVVTMAAQTATQFSVLRFLLGVFEAGFAPGIIYYLSLWYGPERRGGALALLTLAGPIGSIITAPFSLFALNALDGVLGLEGWRWMYLVQGLPSIVLGVICLFFLSDNPQGATWLTDRERRHVVNAVAAAPAKTARYEFRAVIKDPRCYGFALTWFSVICGFYAMAFWMPSIISRGGITSPLQVGLYSAIPYILAIGAMIFLGKSSDRLKERRYHVAIPGMIAAALLVGAALVSNFVVSFSFICLATALIFASQALFWTIPMAVFQGSAAAGGIALINSLGLLGGFVAPMIMGTVSSWFGDIQWGLAAIALILFAGCTSLIFVATSDA